MLLLWVTLLVLHQGYTLVPVTTVPLGESVTFTCALPTTEFGSKQLYWFKQNAGETLTLIVTLLGSTKPEFAPETSDSRLEVKRDNKLSTLTIRTTIPEDEGMYHCLSTESYGNPVWSGTYLLLKGNTQRTSNYSVVQCPTLSDPAPPGNSMTLQCSVLSKYENKTCPGNISVFWFRAGSDKSRPSIIYTDGRRQEECEKLPDTQKSCVYRFSKNFSSSNAGTYYCAAATCGEILFGDVTAASLGNLQTYNIYLLCGISATSLIVISVLIHAIKKSKCECDHNKAAVSLQDCVANMNAKRNDDQWIYSTVIYNVMKTSIGGTRDKKASKRERIYAAAKAF
ncbi:uncharacterized protein [Pseudochaenichthys georgianus]|uniref:uncharacterized protein n=1 Tax=Pseudochaenichthys georgianus TaxID=52239 RepID=UPI00146E0E28|nr:uncharacterized protein LOC117454380 [Pseudochaenichthys georgianus]